MPNIITITTLNGLSPFDVYTCDTGYTTCVYIDTIVSGQIPYSFTIPVVQSGMGSIGVRVVDSDNCEIKEDLTI